MLETAMAIENGADEIDIVISIGEMLDGEYDLAGNEIETLRAEIGDDAILKVILESGTLSDPELIHKAATIAMEAGADFIKTSTGKNGIAATPEAAVAMCLAIRQFAEKTGRKVGFKAAGGISTAESAGTLLQHRRRDPRRRVAHARALPHRRQFAGQQPAQRDRRTRDQILLRGKIPATLR